MYTNTGTLFPAPSAVETEFAKEFTTTSQQRV